MCFESLANSPRRVKAFARLTDLKPHIIVSTPIHIDVELINGDPLPHCKMITVGMCCSVVK